MFSLHGRTKFVTGGEGHQLLTTILETGDERYQWLNDSICILEGVIEGFAMRAQVFQCIKFFGVDSDASNGLFSSSSLV